MHRPTKSIAFRILIKNKRVLTSIRIFNIDCVVKVHALDKDS